MRFLLDTNTCIAAMRAHPKVVSRLATVTPDDCVISTITSFELFTGVEKCARPAEERAKVRLLLETVHELPFDAGAAREAARIRAVLESQGQALGPFDLLIAGHALATSLTLATANMAEFQRVPGLQLENWQA